MRIKQAFSALRQNRHSLHFDKKTHLRIGTKQAFSTLRQNGHSPHWNKTGILRIKTKQSFFAYRQKGILRITVEQNRHSPHWDGQVTIAAQEADTWKWLTGERVYLQECWQPWGLREIVPNYMLVLQSAKLIIYHQAYFQPGRLKKAEYKNRRYVWRHKNSIYHYM